MLTDYNSITITFSDQYDVEGMDMSEEFPECLIG